MPNLKHIRKLTARQTLDMRELRARVKKARQRVSGIIAARANRKNIASSMREREKLYTDIQDVYAELAGQLDEWGENMIKKTADDWSKAAADDITDQSGNKNQVIKFDPQHVKNYMAMIRPDNSQSLAAVFTDQMRKQDIQNLRQTFVETFRQSSLEGWTHNELHARLQSKWDALAGDIAGDRFKDSAGRPWDNARYLQMLVRTTTARVARESYMDTLIQHGDDLVRIDNAGESCPICRAWSGLILSISGLNKNYPSYQDALNAGMFHPNCNCLTIRVDETLDADDIEKQAAVKNADWDDHEKVQQYHNAVEAPGVTSAPPPGSPAEEVRERIRKAEFIKKRDMSEGVNQTLCLTNGEKVVFKSSVGESSGLRPGIRTGTQYRREAAASIIDEELGINLVPPTTIVKYKGQTGSAQKFAAGFKKASDVFVKGEYNHYMKKLGKPTREAFYFLDEILENSDRHFGNFMLKESGKGVQLALIDNGLCLSSQQLPIRVPKNLIKEFKDKPLSAALKDKIMKFLSKEDEIRVKLTPLLEKKALDNLFKRVQNLNNKGRHF